jgi:hypothetical protein
MRERAGCTQARLQRCHIKDCHVMSPQYYLVDGKTCNNEGSKVRTGCWAVPFSLSSGPVERALTVLTGTAPRLRESSRLGATSPSFRCLSGCFPSRSAERERDADGLPFSSSLHNPSLEVPETRWLPADVHWAIAVMKMRGTVSLVHPS